MWAIGPIGFAAPWILIALAGLPVLWWLLRATPPAPKRISFPAIRLLLDLQPDETAARTPWWLLLLRLAAAAFVILALARPVLNPQATPEGAGPILFVLDDGWASGPNWPAKTATIEGEARRAERAGRQVALLATAPGPAGEAPAVSSILPGPELAERIAAREPRPWPPDRAAARAALAQGPARWGAIIWVADGIDHGAPGEVERFAAALSERGPVSLLLPSGPDQPRMLRSPGGDPQGLIARVAVPASTQAREVAVLARTSDGRTLARAAVTLEAGQGEAELPLAMPTELRNRVARLEVEGQNSAGAVALVDERWRRRPVGLVAGQAETADQPLIGELYYLDRALGPFTELRRGSIAELLARELAVVALADRELPDEAELARLAAWVEAGGVLVRFAGPRTAARPDLLLPVALRAGDRQIGGALSWERPASLAPFAPGSPFAGLPTPDEVRIERQVLAEPSPDLGNRTWARLADGTPLVTAAPRGKGMVVLFHVTANASWSSLPLSGLFVEMLARIVALSQGVASAGGDEALPPVEMLDGFGRSVPPVVAAQAILPSALESTRVSPRHPPGLYGMPGESGAVRRALNLGAAEPLPTAFSTALSGVEVRRLDAAPQEADLRPPLFTLAILLLALDLAIALVLRGLAFRGAPKPAPAALLLLALLAGPAAAQSTRPEPAALDTRLAHLITGNPRIDEVASQGLAGLSDFVNRRTATNLGAPAGVRPGEEDLAFYPLIYWPIDAAQAKPSAAAITALNEFMRQGGLILIDTRDGGAGLSGGDTALRRLTEGLAIPNLTALPGDHVLTRAFYLLSEFPGRYPSGPVWVQREVDRANDSVSPVILGGADWASAWAIDAQGRNPYAVTPGGARQRTLAFRFGLNLVVYALTGNYKGDQVHVPAILERLGQ